MLEYLKSMVNQKVRVLTIPLAGKSTYKNEINGVLVCIDQVGISVKCYDGSINAIPYTSIVIVSNQN